MRGILIILITHANISHDNNPGYDVCLIVMIQWNNVPVLGLTVWSDMTSDDHSNPLQTHDRVHKRTKGISWGCEAAEGGFLGLLEWTLEGVCYGLLRSSDIMWCH